MSRTINDPAFMESKDNDFKHKMDTKKHMKHTALDRKVHDYKCNMKNEHKCISDDIIWKKAQKLIEKAKGRLPIRKKVALTSSEGW